ncbi:hypothetical protein CYMTET_2998 [Cymbomonas tetramitiformis]|uniref:Uncharacterized protein n=1 Tax=Cymbomonas tetramitiformis TaxID=36881 RepID=A0AAE0LL93_9CHLO|nr:hypothetical protein CYMTET_2998 [Cymbomonas tetramitiformis]
MEQKTLAEDSVMEAIINDSLNVLKTHVENSAASYVFDCDQLHTAVQHNSIAVLKWSVNQKVKRHAITGWQKEEEWIEAAYHMCLLATRMGHTSLLEWLLTGEHWELFSEAYPDYCLCEEAATHYQWDTLRFLVERGAQGVHCEKTRRYVQQVLDECISETGRLKNRRVQRHLILLKQDICIMLEDFKVLQTSRDD